MSIMELNATTDRQVPACYCAHQTQLSKQPALSN